MHCSAPVYCTVRFSNRLFKQATVAGTYIVLCGTGLLCHMSRVACRVRHRDAAGVSVLKTRGTAIALGPTGRSSGGKPPLFVRGVLSFNPVSDASRTNVTGAFVTALYPPPTATCTCTTWILLVYCCFTGAVRVRVRAGCMYSIHA